MTRRVRRWYAELKPSQYELKIVPDVAALTFHGAVTIRLRKTGRPSQRLTFHQNGLRVTRAQVIKQDKKESRELVVVRINHQNRLQEVRLHTAEMVYSGEYEVRLEFEGAIKQSMTGLYASSFKFKGREQVMLATQFESHHAREVFPCIDEPEAKAVFQLTLVAAKAMTVLSNTPMEKQEGLSDSLVATTFAPTPRMSTYLLAFVIGELHAKTTRTKGGTEVSVWATVAQPAEAFDFGLDAAKRSIEFFEEYFGVPYPLPKADHVAIPDFGTGSAAMENWGLVTYREDYLLSYPGQSSQASKEHVAIGVAHETSHQWFGNLTTMRWWDELWLNESFASIMEYEAVDHMFPDWQVWDEFVARDGLLALRRDATPGVQAVKTAVHHPDEIGTLFDPYIMYAKGSRLMNMLKAYIGEAAFRRGLGQYFAKYAYQNTTGEDLWRALSDASGADLSAFMNPWLERSGFPVVTVEQDGASVTLKQQHFLENGEVSDGRIWPVPLFSTSKDVPVLLDKVERRCRLPNKEWIYINQRAAGHYLVHYAGQAHRARLVELVRERTLGVADRLILLNSASMLAKAGYQSFGDVLQLLGAYEHETSEPVWSTMALIAAEARRFIDWNEKLEPAIQRFVSGLIQAEYRRLGWDGATSELPADRKLRGLILGLGVYAEEGAIVQEALRRFEAYRKGSAEFDPELRSLLFGVAVRQKVSGAFQFLAALHDETNNSDLQGDVAAALCFSRDPQEVSALLERMKDPQLVRPQDMQHWLVYLLRNRHAREQAWRWMVDNWSWIAQRYSHDKSYDNIPRYAASVCNTPEWAARFEALFKPLEREPALKRNIAVGLTEINTRVKWLERDLSAVQHFLSTRRF